MDSGHGRGWTVTFAGMGINLALGVLYTWSVIKKAVPPEWGWNDADKALPNAVACIVFALMMVPAGRLQDKFGPRWVATAGGILTGAGCIIAAWATTVFWYVAGFGILAGTGIGLGYSSATPAAVKWFPARKTGFITGLVVAGFGLASVYISPLANYLTGYNLAGNPLPALAGKIHDAASASIALQAQQSERAGTGPLAGSVAESRAVFDRSAAELLALREANIRKTLLVFGIGFLILVTLLAQLLSVPPSENPAPAPMPGRAGPPGVGADLGPAAMIATPLFYLLWLMMAFGSGAGLMIIGNVTTIAKLGNIEAGFVLVALLAVGNASGRIIAGMISDRIGRLWTMFVIFAFQSALMMVLRAGLTQMAAFVAVSMLLGFNYGACLSVFPSAVKDNFGLRHFGVNYGLVFTSWGVGGFVLPLVAGSLFEAERSRTGAGNYDQAYLLATTLLLAAAVLTFATRGAERSHKAKQAWKSPLETIPAGR